MRLTASDDTVRKLYGMCSQDEKRRAETFRFEKHRRRFIIGRGLLRTLLSTYLEKSPDNVQFQYGTKGKPALNGDYLTGLHFNVAHCEECVLYAISQEAELGVDVERVRDLQDAESVAEQFFSPLECIELRRTEPTLRSEAFFNCWTRKEAYVKALGDGLNAPLDRFQVSMKPGRPAVFLKFDNDSSAAYRWRLHHLGLPERYIGAVAIPALGCSVIERGFRDADQCLDVLGHRDIGSE